MEGFNYVDIFATKGIEYLFVIVFLLVFIPFFIYLNRTQKGAQKIAEQIAVASTHWFRLIRERFYHQGHSWILPEDKSIVRVGIDDFAQLLLGTPQAIKLPQKGSVIEQGEKAWQLEFGKKKVDMLSPVSGEVLEVNQTILDNPHKLNEDPYHEGWLMKVKVKKMRRDVRNLISGNLANAWFEETINKLRKQLPGDLGPVLQDGGSPIPGFVKQLSPDNWEEIASEFLLTKE